MTNSCPTIQRTQLAGANQPYDVDVGLRAVQPWAANATMNANALVAPSKCNRTGFVYATATPGQTGSREPAWGTSAGATVSDGSITWTAVTPPASGEDGIASVIWTQDNPPDDTLMITSQTNTSLVASAFIGGGTSGNLYVIVVSVSMESGAIYPVRIILTIL